MQSYFESPIQQKSSYTKIIFKTHVIRSQPGVKRLSINQRNCRY